MYTWVRATTITLTELLREHMEADPGLRPFFSSAVGGTHIVSAGTPQEMGENNLTGLSVWLYRINRDEQLVNHPPRRISFDQIEKPRLPLRLHYLITPVMENNVNGIGPRLEHTVIGKVLQTLHDHSLLAGTLLRDDLAGSGVQIAVRLEQLDLDQTSRIWDALESSYQLCVSYEASVVLLASDVEASRFVPVDVVAPEYGVITEVDAES